MIFSKKCMIFNHFLRKKNVPGQKHTMCIAMDKEIFDTDGFSLNLVWNGILFPKLFWPSVRKNCSSDREKLEITKGQWNSESSEQFWVTECFLTFPGGFSYVID